MKLSDSVKVLDQEHGNNWSLYQADVVDAIKGIPDDSVGYSIFSPPFISLYTFSDSERDMSNVRSREDFHEHFGFLIHELLRVTKPGRLMSIHCMTLTTTMATNGVIGLIDFRGELIRAAVESGWVWHTETAIWKDPVSAMQRTKALGLLYKQLKKDSCMSRQGLADYLCTFRKPGTNIEPVTHTESSFPLEKWQRYASPVWASFNGVDDEGFLVCVNPNNMNPDKCGILAGETLQRESAREEKDERHICPLQLEVIRRGIELWTNQGDTVLSPFAGIGSEGFVSLRTGRRFVGIELKRSYYEQAIQNLRGAVRQKGLFEGLETEAT